MSPMIPAETNTTAMARSSVIPHQSHTRLVTPPDRTHGITRNSVSGPIKNAVRGEVIFSRDCPNPKTLHCRSRGTTFWRIVCSQASAIGLTTIQRKNHIPTNQIDDTRGKMIQILQPAIFTRRRDRTGLFPSPYLAMIDPPTMNHILVTARTIPQSSTETIERP